MSKRTHSEATANEPSDSSRRSNADEGDSVPFSKRLLSSSEPITFTRVRSLEELDKRALQLQNKKLWEALMERRASIAELRERIEQLENRQAKDDALLCVINRYWNQLDEDSLILLQRFDADAEDEISTSTESFLKQLASWDKEEVPEKLQERVHFSKRIIARLLSAYERLIARQSRLRQLSRNRDSNKPDPSSEGASSVDEADSTQPDETAASEPTSQTAEKKPQADGSGNTNDQQCTAKTDEVTILRDELAQLNKENQRLQSLCTQLHAKHRQSSLHVRELQDLAQTNSDSAAEWQAKYEDLDYKLSQALNQITRLDHRLYDAQQLNKQLEVDLAAFKGIDSPSNDEPSSGTSGAVNRSKYNDLVCELEELRELAANRLSELERIQRQLEEKVGECASLNMRLNEVSEDQILGSPQYTSLKAQFNLLYNEAIQLRSQLEEARTSLQSNRHSHLKNIEEMEANEAAIQNQMRSEMLLIESQYSQLRRTHETMELDFKQALAHNEQAGPINSEMRSLISTLQTQNKQLKAEVARYRRKSKEISQDLEMVRADLKSTEDELAQVRNALSDATAAVVAAGEKAEPTTPMNSEVETKPATVDVGTTSSTPSLKQEEISPYVDKGVNTCANCRASSSLSQNVVASKLSLKQDACSSDTQHTNLPGSASSDEIIRDLKEQLKRSQESQKEMSVLLNMYKVIPKDQRDKAALLQCEAKLRSEVAEQKNEIEKLHSTVMELQQQNARLLQIQQQQRKPLHNPPANSNFKASPVDRTSTQDRSHTVVTVSPSSVPQKATALSPDDKGSGTKSHQTGFKYKLTELQLELQIAQRRCQSLESQVEVCQHRLSAAQQQEEVLLKEMEVTGQAFEDVQEQNVRLVRTLREKDDANLKLMTERLKTAQLARLLKEDKHLLEEQIRLMQAKIEALNRAVLKQEDKERLLLTNLTTLEKEATARQQAQEAYKRKSLESQQVAEDLRVTVQKYQSQLKEAQVSVQEKASAFERVSFRHQRLQEELVTLRRKYERLRKIEQSHNADEVLLAEIQDYKEQLTCPTCKTNKKDAILTKCFHVFCLNCLKTRYETRNRKCPKCNATFGANDYHRIYLS
ncbi:unnamed protein product [Calicophoron daubneyi]|uniref:E3 ubiquitin protein ligase n=1 Tax=Calicophoron daubneyi TaxID=300641 RepID=A0AAV2TFY4_CALDB